MLDGVSGKSENIFKKSAEKFAGKEKSRTFATRLRNNGNKSSSKYFFSELKEDERRRRELPVGNDRLMSEV